MAKGESTEVRFWQKVQKAGDNDCWMWRGTVDRNGYGRLKRPGSRQEKREFMAHQLSWELHFGANVHKKYVLHHCDTPGCVNPKHLWLGTAKDNSDDKIAKGRFGSRIGRMNGNARLTEDAVKDILSALKGGATQQSLADLHGVKQPQISRIALGTSWSHLK